MPTRELNTADVRRLGSAKAAVSLAQTVNFDFGTPDDLNIPALSNFKHGDTILVVFTATTSGTTDRVTFSVQDAADSSGSIGTPATAITDGTLTTLGPTTAVAHTAVRLQSGRPWLRCRVTSVGTTDSWVATCQVFAVSPSV